jgi:XTP/dITP diphosphohydrolase
LERIAARLASRNEHKLRELQESLPGWDLTLIDADEFPPEDGPSYYENALAKARFGHTIADDAWILGEDSGLEVDALGGGPGVGSARFAPDEDFVGRLLGALAGIEGDGRRARYVCELVGLSPDLLEVRGTGMLEGTIGHEPRGSEGFGYDPVFLPDGETRTVAELGNKWKIVHSHRARAARALREALR